MYIEVRAIARTQENVAPFIGAPATHRQHKEQL
jgi:hypothetical protein